MAEYLLKGGKMLAKTCPDCSSPLFEYKGETFCTVCREEQMEYQENMNKAGALQHPADIPSSVKKKQTISDNSPETLNDAFALTIESLLRQAREEQDIRRLNDLMKAIKTASEAYAILTYGYESRERS